MNTRVHHRERKQRFEGGSTRSAKLERFDLVPPEGEMAVARRFRLGAVKHGENNWQRGGAEFIKSTISHLKAHIANLLLTAGECEDDDVGAILWAGHALAWFRERKPEEYKKALRSLRGGSEE